MSIIVSGLSFAYPNQENVLDGISLSVPNGGKASVVGDNGCGKSTLLRLLTGELIPQKGEITLSEPHYTVPQHFGQYDGETIASVLGIAEKIDALNDILAGNADERDYDILQDDWDIEERIAIQLDQWGIGHLSPDTPFGSMSGGEKTRAFIAGIGITSPSVILMDEPSNHLDREGREKLYELIGRSGATIMVVSHDRELLNLVGLTFELSPKGITRYGGNYDFYRSVRDEHIAALVARIEEKEKTIRQAHLTARSAVEAKNKSDARGEKQKQKEGIPKILMGGLKDKSQKSTANLREVLTGKVERTKEELHGLKRSLNDTSRIKLNFKDPQLHTGKILVEATAVDFNYDGGRELWRKPLDLLILSGERIRIEGGNGSGKTTLLKLITGELEPVTGIIKRSDLSHIYMDQQYGFIDNDLTVYGQLEKHNRRQLSEYELKTELHRFLFPQAVWDNLCSGLSGGEKMRLMLCCLLVNNDTPDMFILDEPTNNLDISSMEILTSVLKDYRGTLLVISHDNNFARDIGLERVIRL